MGKPKVILFETKTNIYTDFTQMDVELLIYPKNTIDFIADRCKDDPDSDIYIYTDNDIENSPLMNKITDLKSKIYNLIGRKIKIFSNYKPYYSTSDLVKLIEQLDKK